MANTKRKTEVEALPVMGVEFVAPAEYVAAVEKMATRFAAMKDSAKLVGFSRPYNGREGTITSAVWAALCQADGCDRGQVLAAALRAENEAHKARGKAPKGTGMSAQGWLRLFGATFA